MPGNPRLHVRVSEPNLRKLRRISGDHGVHMGALVDDALTLYFTPPEDRPDAAILRMAPPTTGAQPVRDRGGCQPGQAGTGSPDRAGRRSVEFAYLVVKPRIENRS